MDPFAHGLRKPITALTIALATAVSTASAGAEPNCSPIAAKSLEIQVASCNDVLPELQGSRQFPDVFAGSGKALNLCYVSTAPVKATIGNTPVRIASSLSAWTTDFIPVLFGGTDNLGTVVTQLTIADLRGNSLGKLFTRDTIDLSQIFTTGTASEEDVIVGGTGPLQNAKGTYRVASVPEDQNATKVLLTDLSGVVCIDGQ